MTEAVQRIEPLLRVSTNQLMLAVENGRREGYSYTLNPQVEPFINAEAAHILQSNVFLDHMAGKRVPAYVRSTARIVAMDSTEPIVVRLDVRLRDWLALPPLKDLTGSKLADEQVINMEFREEDILADDRTPI